MKKDKKQVAVEKLLSQLDNVLSNLYDSGAVEDPETGDVTKDVSNLEKRIAETRKVFGIKE